MVIAIVVLLIGSLLVAGALTLVRGDIQLTSTETAQKKAYFAAVSGINEYKYRLNVEPGAWKACFSTTQTVPGTTDETYEVKTLGANGHAKCEANLQSTVIETAGSASGTFRVESTGTVGKAGTAGYAQRKIVATFKHPGFLDYVFLSNYEVEDPTTTGANSANCEHYYLARKAGGWLNECPAIDFIAEDELKGPFHTNDAVSICGFGGTSPIFGRKSPGTDTIEMNGGHYAGTDGPCSNTPVLQGKYTEAAPTLLPPEEPDAELLQAAGYIFKGRTVIELEEGSPNKMKVTIYNSVTKKFEKETKNFPTNGVVYAENVASCPAYSPFVYDKGYETDETTPTCGNVYIKGKYTESLTVASANDIVIIGNLETTQETPGGKPIGVGLLGLIAHNFVRVYHPVECTSSCTNNSFSCNGTNQSKATDPRGWGALLNPVVDAAILATKHSWIVDNFTCGSSLNKLTVWGAIAQFWRGRVTQGVSGGGYPSKNYNYDERMATGQPPSFLAPTATSGWRITRETQPQNGFG